MIKKLYREFGLGSVKNDLARRDLFWYAVLEKFGIEFGDYLWYDSECVELAVLRLPKKLRKKIRQDAIIQGQKIDGKLQRKNQPYKTKITNTSTDPANSATTGRGTLAEGEGA